MKRILIAIAALTLAAASSASADTRTYFGFQIGIGNAPPPPRVYYRERPAMVYEPDTRVYVINDPNGDNDIFRYGPYYYMVNDDYWYRARSYRGPFIAVDVRNVPEPIFRVPQQRWHRYPMGLARYSNDHGWGRGRGHYNNRGRGHDRGRGHQGDDREHAGWQN